MTRPNRSARRPDHALWHDLGIVNAEDGVTFDNAAVAAAIPVDHHDSEILETGEWISATPLFVPYQLIAMEPATARRFGDETNGVARA